MRTASLLAGGILVGCLTAAGCATSTTFHARDAGVAFDLQGYIDQQCKAGATHIVVPPGRHRVTPSRSQHLVLKNLRGIEIDARGAELVCTETTRAITFDRCERVTLRGLSIDYDPLPFTQGRIVALAPDRAWLEFEIIDGYPDQQLEERIEIYDPATGELRRDTARWQGIESLGQRRYRATKPTGYRFDAHRDTEQLGDILVTNHAQAPGGSAGHAVVLQGCTNVLLRDIDLYASNCFGFLEDGCSGTVYEHCRVDRRSPASDFPPRAAPRMRSLDADAFHSVGASVGPTLRRCTAKFQGDDGVNIHGSYHLVTARSGAVLRVLAKHHLDLAAGCTVAFLDYDGRRPADARVLGIAPDGAITADESDFLARQHMDEGLRQNRGNGLGRAYLVTLDRAVDLKRGALICNQERIGNGFAVESCDFGYNRSRGILIKAGRGRVTDNRIVGGWMAAILVAPEFWWLEAGSSDDVLIAGNRIGQCRGTAIEVSAAGGDGRVAAAGAHRNIEVTNNVVRDAPSPVLRVTSTTGLVVRNNDVGGGTVLTTNCPDALIRGNR